LDVSGPLGSGLRIFNSSNNTFQNITASNRVTAGIDVSGASNNNTIQCSSILNNTVGVRVRNTSSGIVANDNHIAGNSVGVQNLSSPVAVVNAENNFWGAADGPSPPGSGDAIVGNVDADPFRTFLPPCVVQEVQIDVKPGSDPNSVNLTNNGQIAVAIFTTDDFDATQVDASTVVFAGAFAVQHALEDVDNDGDLDMVLHFNTQDTNLLAIYEQLLLDDEDRDGTLDSTNQEAEVSVTGETLTDQAFQGFDELNLFLKGKSLRDLLEELFL
jgi:hypothetical protein